MGNPNAPDDPRATSGVYLARCGPRVSAVLLDRLAEFAMRQDSGELALAVVGLEHGRDSRGVELHSAQVLRYLGGLLAQAADDIETAPTSARSVATSLGEAPEVLAMIVAELRRSVPKNDRDAVEESLRSPTNQR